LLLDQIQSDLNAAMKGRDQAKVDALRFLLGEIKNLEITKYPPSSFDKLGTSEGQVPPSLTNEDVISVVQKQVRTHKESIEMFEKGGRSDLVDREQAQLAILQSYLPAQMSPEEIRNKTEEIRKNNPEADFGTMMKLAMQELRGRADGAVVSRLLKSIITS